MCRSRRWRCGGSRTRERCCRGSARPRRRRAHRLRPWPAGPLPRQGRRQGRARWPKPTLPFIPCLCTSSSLKAMANIMPTTGRTCRRTAALAVSDVADDGKGVAVPDLVGEPGRQHLRERRRHRIHRGRGAGIAQDRQLRLDLGPGRAARAGPCRLQPRRPEVAQPRPSPEPGRGRDQLVAAPQDPSAGLEGMAVTLAEAASKAPERTVARIALHSATTCMAVRMEPPGNRKPVPQIRSRARPGARPANRAQSSFDAKRLQPVRAGKATAVIASHFFDPR
jgi:hypothetical protein